MVRGLVPSVTIILSQQINNIKQDGPEAYYALLIDHPKFSWAKYESSLVKGSRFFG